MNGLKRRVHFVGVGGIGMIADRPGIILAGLTNQPRGIDANGTSSLSLRHIGPGQTGGPGRGNEINADEFLGADIRGSKKLCARRAASGTSHEEYGAWQGQ